MRSLSETGLPWTVQISSAEPAASGSWEPERRLVIFGLGAVLSLLVAGSYFVGRAIRIEADVLRLQSEFVAACRMGSQPRSPRFVNSERCSKWAGSKPVSAGRSTTS